MAYDVFVSYSSADRVLAEAIVHELETAGIGCWIAPRDILPGANYGEAIVAAIQDVEVMVVVVSDHANRSGHVPREVERAAAHNVSLVPLRIADIEPSPSLNCTLPETINISRQDSAHRATRRAGTGGWCCRLTHASPKQSEGVGY